MAELQSHGENATASSEPDCGNGTMGNCSALDPTAGGSPGALMIISFMLYGLICAAGTVGNGLVIYVVLRYVCLSVCLTVSVSDSGVSRKKYLGVWPGPHHLGGNNG